MALTVQIHFNRRINQKSLQFHQVPDCVVVISFVIQCLSLCFYRAQYFILKGLAPENSHRIFKSYFIYYSRIFNTLSKQAVQIMSILRGELLAEIKIKEFATRDPVWPLLAILPWMRSVNGVHCAVHGFTCICFGMSGQHLITANTLVLLPIFDKKVDVR